MELREEWPNHVSDINIQSSLSRAFALNYGPVFKQINTGPYRGPIDCMIMPALCTDYMKKKQYLLKRGLRSYFENT